MKMMFEDSDSRLRQRAFKGSWTNTSGRRFGCLKRRSKVGEICPLFSEAIKVIPKKEWDDYLKDKPSMWPDVQFTYDQNGVGCHDDQTEVLTESRWQFWSEYDHKSALGTINPLTHALEFQLPTHLHSFDYNGPLHYVDNNALNFALTPNHRMYVRKWNERNRTLNDNYDICETKDVGWYSGLLSSPSSFIGTELVKVKIGNVIYNGDDFMALIALIISDGWVGGKESTWNRTGFCCFRQDRIEMVKKLAYSVEFKEQPNRNGVWVQSNPELSNWLRSNVFTCDNFTSTYKRIPSIVKCASQRQIELFLKFYGDQHINNESRRQFYTSSDQLADDIQELLLRIGKRSGIYTRSPRSAIMSDGRIIDASHCKNDHTITEHTTDRLSLERKKTEIETYKGMVYCATVPNSLLVTRRNKKVLISGNSCAAESTVGNFTTTRVFNGLPLVEFNPWFVYNTTSGGRDGGSSIDENLEFMRKYGVAPASIWPRSKGWRAKPSAEAYAEALKYRVIEFYDITNAEELGSALLQGFCVTFGRSGHAIYSIELVSTTTHRYMNSWGDWGDKGTEVENLSRINWGYGAFAIRVVTDTDGPVFKPRLSEMPPINPRFEAFPTIEAA